MSGFQTLVQRAAATPGAKLAARAAGTVAAVAAAAAAAEPPIAGGGGDAGERPDGDAPLSLADARAPLELQALARRNASLHSYTHNLTVSQVLHYDDTSGVTALALLSILGGFIAVFAILVALSRVLAVTNRPKAEAFPYAASGGRGMYQPSANLPPGGSIGPRMGAKPGAMQGSGAGASLLASAAPMGQQVHPHAGGGYGDQSVDSLSFGSPSLGMDPAPQQAQYAGRQGHSHARGASTGLGFPGPPAAARRGAGAGAHAGSLQHPPLPGGLGGAAGTTLAVGPDGSGFAPPAGPGPGPAANGHANPQARMRNPLHTGPPPLATDARRQSRYAHAQARANAGAIADRRSRIQSVGAGVYRKSMYMDGDAPASDPANQQAGVRRVESISRGNSLRYRERGAGGDAGADGVQRRPSAAKRRSMAATAAGARRSAYEGGAPMGRSASANAQAGGQYPPSQQQQQGAQYPPSQQQQGAAQRRPSAGTRGPSFDAARASNRRSIYGGERGNDVERGAFLSAQREGFGAGPATLQPQRNGSGSSGSRATPQLAPIDTSAGPLGAGAGSAGYGQQEFLRTPSPGSFQIGHVVPSPTHSTFSASAAGLSPAASPGLGGSAGSSGSSAGSHAPAPAHAGAQPSSRQRHSQMPVQSGYVPGHAALRPRPGQPGLRQNSASSASVSGGGSGGGPLGGSAAGADIDLFASAPLPRGASSYGGPGGAPSFVSAVSSAGQLPGGGGYPYGSASAGSSAGGPPQGFVPGARYAGPPPGYAAQQQTAAAGAGGRYLV